MAHVQFSGLNSNRHNKVGCFNLTYQTPIPQGAICYPGINDILDKLLECRTGAIIFKYHVWRLGRVMHIVPKFPLKWVNDLCDGKTRQK